MKKILCIAIATLISVSLVHAEDNDEPGNIGIGYQGIYWHGYNGSDSMNAVSVRMAPKPIGGQVTFGQMRYVPDGDFVDEEQFWSIQGKVFYALIDREYSDFYVGGRLGYYLDEPGDAETEAWTFAPLFGAEWRWKEAPEIGVNFEVAYDYIIAEEEDPGWDGDFWSKGIDVSLGIHYYF